jgi:hypothetical protein
MNKGFYNIIIDDYETDAHLCARIYQDKTCTIHLKKGNELIDKSNDSRMIKAFINRANEKLKGSRSSHFKISFDYRNNRLHFNVRKGGVITMSESQRVLKADNTTEIVFNRKNDLFIPQNYCDGNDILSKFDAMRDCAMGFIQIINYSNLTKAS